MSKLTITLEEMGDTKTFQRAFEYDPTSYDVMETFLSAYESFTFMNDIDLVVRNEYAGDVAISWDKDNGVYVGEHEGCHVCGE